MQGNDRLMRQDAYGTISDQSQSLHSDLDADSILLHPPSDLNVGQSLFMQPLDSIPVQPISPMHENV